MHYENLAPFYTSPSHHSIITIKEYLFLLFKSIIFSKAFLRLNGSNILEQYLLYHWELLADLSLLLVLTCNDTLICFLLAVFFCIWVCLGDKLPSLATTITFALISSSSAVSLLVWLSIGDLSWIPCKCSSKSSHLLQPHF